MSDDSSPVLPRWTTHNSPLKRAVTDRFIQEQKMNGVCMNAVVDSQNQKAVELNKNVFCLGSTWNHAMTSLQRSLTIKQFRLMKIMNGKVLFPFHNDDYGGHWILGILDLGKRVVYMLDSCPHEQHDYMADCQTMIDFFLETLDDPEVIAFYIKGRMNSAKQNDDYNCGIFVLLYIKYLVEGKRIPNSFSQTFLKQKRLEFHRDVTLEFGFPLPKGIRNLGNTCFMNPVFQMLCTSTLWRNLLKTSSTQDKPLTRLLLEFQENMARSGQTHKSPLYPVDLYNQIQSALPVFGDGKTHDCHEFMETLFNYLNLESRELNMMYTGTFLEITNCSGCTDLGYESRESYPDFISLQVEIPDKPKSFMHCLDRYFQEETVNDGHCDACNPAKNDIPMPSKKRKLAILTAPPELIIQLKRFNNRLAKRRDILVPPTMLNIEEYCSDVPPEDHHYRLFGVVVHKTNHYVAYFKVLDPEATNNKRLKWFFFDDDKTPVEVHPNFLNSVEAYLCLYEKVENPIINVSDDSTNEGESDPKDGDSQGNGSNQLKKRKASSQENQPPSKKGRHVPQSRPAGGKVVLDWTEFDLEAKNHNLIITARELWLACSKDISKYKYNKDLKPKIRDIPRMVLKRFTTESIHKEVGECRCKMEKCEKSKFRTEDIIKERRAFFFSNDKDEYLRNKISSLYSEKTNNVTYRLAGRELCQEAFYLLIGSSYYTIGKLTKECTNSGGQISTKVCSFLDLLLISQIDTR